MPKPIARLFFMQLPLFTAVMLDVFTQVFMHDIQQYSALANLIAKSLLISTPFFLAHYFALRFSAQKALLVWLLGFVVYPAIILYFQYSMLQTDLVLLNSQSIGFAVIASLCHLISLKLKQRNTTAAARIMSKLLSLNSVVACLLIVWVTLVAGMFVSTVDPMNNQPLMPVIDSKRLVENVGLYFSYWLQFGFLALIIASIYACNRYLLIRKVLEQQGVFSFVAASLLCILIFTPILASAALLLPLNQGTFTLIPSENQNPFDPINFRIFFALLAVSTPIILAFERQQQHAAMESVARRQTLTELKLLQQQINPHFLFNTLNNLYALTLKKSEQAPELLMQLANLLRYSVYEGQKPQVNLAKEMDYLRDYLALQKIRLGDKCTFDLEWPDDPQNWTIPPLLLIVLLENAFKHGIEKSSDPSQLTMKISINNNQLSMRCINPIIKSDEKAEAGGVGLDNLKRRLALLFPGKFQMVSEQSNNHWHAYLQLELSPC